MDADSNERIYALEVKVSYLENFLLDLQNEAVKRTADLERLKSAYARLSEKVESLSESEIVNGKPPHY